MIRPDVPEPDRLGTVLQVLAAVGQDLDAQGVLDVLWLAHSLSGDPAALPLAAARSRSQHPADGTAAEDESWPEPDQEAPGELKLPDEDLPDLTLPGLHAAPLPPPPAYGSLPNTPYPTSRTSRSRACRSGCRKRKP